MEVECPLRRGRRIQHNELAVGAEGRGRDEGLLKQDADVRDEVARCGMICAVEHEVVLLHDQCCVFRGEMFTVGDVLW